LDGKLFRITQENGSRKALVFLTIEEMEKLFDFVVHVPDIEMDFGYRIKLEEAPE